MCNDIWYTSFRPNYFPQNKYAAVNRAKEMYWIERRNKKINTDLKSLMSHFKLSNEHNSFCGEKCLYVCLSRINTHCVCDIVFIWIDDNTKPSCSEKGCRICSWWLLIQPIIPILWMFGVVQQFNNWFYSNILS